MLHSTGFNCLLNAFFAANLAASDDSTGTKAISLFKKIFDFNKKILLFDLIFKKIIQQTSSINIPLNCLTLESKLKKIKLIC
ncbi:hypothetical protein BpHYR1_031018 [Brachionus plicatilis]|uniref:Uncharacterized protein n=1 Tax=Brachionus plicatilis TaxID=10195 RepID=A0A3M7PWP9_BRAPC|nr:hypothetical protein BpHYR1_031018 [Brachionus plicatilis]